MGRITWGQQNNKQSSGRLKWEPYQPETDSGFLDTIQRQASRYSTNPYRQGFRETMISKIGKQYPNVDKKTLSDLIYKTMPDLTDRQKKRYRSMEDVKKYSAEAEKATSGPLYTALSAVEPLARIPIDALKLITGTQVAYSPSEKGRTIEELRKEPLPPMVARTSTEATQNQLKGIIQSVLLKYGGKSFKSPGKDIISKVARGGITSATAAAPWGVLQSIEEGNFKNLLKNVAQSAATGLVLGGVTSGIGGSLSKIGANKGIESSVLQIVDKKTGRVSFKTIQKGQLENFKNIIDDTKSGIAGKNIEGKIYHLTAKTPESMKRVGAKFAGMAKTTDVPTFKTPSSSSANIDKRVEDLASIIKGSKTAGIQAKSSIGRSVQNPMMGLKSSSPKTYAQMAIYRSEEGKLLGQGEILLNKLKKDKSVDITGVYKEILTKDRAKLSGTAKDIVKILDTRAQELKGAGVPIGNVKKYFPRMLDPGKKEEAIKWLVDNGYKQQADIVREVYKRGFRASKADIEYSRIFEDIPAGFEKFYVKDPLKVLANWNRETASRLAEAKVFGTKLEKMTLEGLSPSQRKYTEDIYNMMRYGKEANKFGQAIRGTQTFTKMGLSVIANATQTTNTAATYGIGRTLKGVMKTLSKPKESASRALKKGINLTEITDTLSGEIYEGANKSLMVKAGKKLLDFSQFSKIERFNRIVAAESAESAIKRWANNPTKYAKHLKEHNINPQNILKRGLSDDDLAIGVREGVRKTQFYTTPEELPLWTTKGELGRTVTQLSKFSIKQGEFIKNEIIKKAVRGDVVPFFRYLLVGTAFGEMTIGVRNLLSGNKREHDWNEPLARALDDIGGAGGFGYLVDAIDSMKYGRNGVEKVAKAFGGPTVGDLFDIGSIYDSLASGDNEQASKIIAKKILGFVPYSKQALAQLKKTGVSYGGIPYIGGGLEQATKPYDPKYYEETRIKIDKNLEKTISDTGYKIYQPSRTQRDKKLNDEEYRTLTKKINQNVAPAISSLIDSSFYQQKTKEEKKNALIRLNTIIRDNALDEMFGKKPKNTKKPLQSETDFYKRLGL